MKQNEDKNQSSEPTQEASDLLMDSLLQNVAENREGADDEAFLAGVETLLDVNSGSEILPESETKTKLHPKRRLQGGLSAGIAAAAVIGISTVLAVVSIDRLKFQRMAMEDDASTANLVPAHNYLAVETSPTTADQLAQAKRAERIAAEERDSVIAQIGHEHAELEIVEKEVSFVATELEETLGRRKEIDLSTGVRSGSGGSISTSGNINSVPGGQAGKPKRSGGSSGLVAGFSEINSAPVPAGSTGVQPSPSKNDIGSFVQIGHGGMRSNVEGKDAAILSGENRTVTVATKAPNSEGPRFQPLKKLFGRSKELNQSDAALPPAASTPVTAGLRAGAKPLDDRVTVTGAGVTVIGGAYQDDFAKIGHGGTDAWGQKEGEFIRSEKFMFDPVAPQRNLIDNPWKSPLGEPLSTFSIDVDTASWTNIRGMLKRGIGLDQIPPDSVRVEEMINYFDWKYPQPRDGQPFGFAVESAQCPWNADAQLLRVAIQGKDVRRDTRPEANLVFLLDVSGSMNQENKLPLVQKSIELMIEEMNENDCVSIVVYAGAEGVALHPTSGNQQAEIMDALKRLKAGGSTNGGAGINLAYKMASQNFIKDGVNRVILCTDGDFNVGLTGTETLTQLVERKAKRDRVFLSVCGFGNDNLNDAMLESITNKGNGTYYFIDTIAEARKVFLKDMMATLVTIAKDVKIQVEFNPGQVKAYRLIGYANRRLAAKDFEDDRVDAGEIGAGHSVTAFYEVVPSASQRDPLRELTSNLRYQKDAAPKPAPQPERVVIDSPELALLKLRYKEPDGDVSKLIEKPVMPNGQDWKNSSEDFRFASAVALFGMKLRGNDSVRTVELPEIIDLAESAVGTDPHGYRAEFVKLLKAAK